MTLKAVYQGILELLYPRRCPVCGKALDPREGLIHTACADKLTYISEPRCKMCGRQLPPESRDEFCTDCTRRKLAYEKGMGVFLHDAVMRQSIYMFKYGGRREYALFYCSEMMRLYRQELVEWGLEAVVPVPIHITKLKARGYNQAEELARPVARELGVPLITDALIRTDATAAQKDLSLFARSINLSQAFSCIKGCRLPSRILLVDDIYTTGATVHRCAETLISAGATRVFSLTVSVGGGT